MVPDSEYRIKLQVFEGPLDLLLFLIRKSELDIYDIPIESVTKQYVDALHAMRQLDLDVAGEFFVMAATLMEIKSRMLLPRGLAAVDTEADDEAMDPRWELVHQLLQYKKFKEAAAKLNELVSLRQDLMERYVSSISSEQADRPLKSVDRIELWNAFNIVLRRLAEKLVVGEIHDEQVTVSDRMEYLLQRVQTQPTFIFTELFPGKLTLRMLVATFLAVLELTRLKKLRIRQDEAFGDIVCTAVVEAPLVETPPLEAPAGDTPPVDRTATEPPLAENSVAETAVAETPFAEIPTVIGTEPVVIETAPTPEPPAEAAQTSAAPEIPLETATDPNTVKP